MTPQVMMATLRQQRTVLGESSRGGQGRNCGCCLPMPFDHQSDFFSTRKAMAMMESRHWTAALQPVRCSGSSSPGSSSRSSSARRPLALLLLLLLPMLAVLLPLAIQRSAVVADGLASEEEGAASAGPPSGEERGSSSLPGGRSGKQNYWRTENGLPLQLQARASSFKMRARGEAEGVEWRRVISVEKGPFVIAFENTAGPVNNTFSEMPQAILTRLSQRESGSPSPPISPTPLGANELPPLPVRESNVLNKGEVVVLNPWGPLPMGALPNPIATVESVTEGSFFHIACGLQDDVETIPPRCIETLRALPSPEPGKERFLFVQLPFWGALPLVVTLASDVTLPNPAGIFFDCMRKGPLDDMKRGLCHGNMRVDMDPGLYDRYVTGSARGIHITIKGQLKSRCYCNTRIWLASNEELIIEGDEPHQEQRMRGNYHLYSSPDIFVVIPSDMKNEALDVEDSEILKQPGVVSIGRHVLKISPSEQPMKFVCEGKETAVSLKDGVDVQLKILPVKWPYLPSNGPLKADTTLIMAEREGHYVRKSFNDNIGEDRKVVRRIRCGTKGGSPDAIMNCVSSLPTNLSTHTHEVIISATDRGDLLKLLGAALKTAKDKEGALGVFKLLLAKRQPDKTAADYIGPGHRPQNRGWDPALWPNFKEVTAKVWRRNNKFCFDFLVIKFYADTWQLLPDMKGGNSWLQMKEGKVSLTFGLTNNIDVKTSAMSREMRNDLQLPPVRSFRLKRRPVGSATARSSFTAFQDVQVVCGSTPWALNSNVREHIFTAVPVSMSVNHHDLYEKAMSRFSRGRAE